jgi:nitroreductase
MEFIDLINKRKSIRKFTEKPVEKEKLDKILEIINKSPSAKNQQSYEIYVVKNKDLQKKMYEKNPRQPFLFEASYILVFCGNLERAEASSGERGLTLYAINDVSIACTYAHLATYELGLASVWVGAFNEEFISNLLDLPKYLRPMAMLPIGYAAENPDPKPRRNLKDFVRFIEG